MVNGFKIKKYWILTFCMVLCSLASFAQDLSDQQIGFDVARTTAMLKEHGVTGQELDREIALMRENERVLYLEMKKSEDAILKKIRAGQNIRGTNNRSQAVIEVPENERAALIAFYNNTGGANWKNTKANDKVWNINDPNSDISTWYGVTVTDGHVTSIVLWHNDLDNDGVALPDLRALGSLEILNLIGNTYLEGSLINLQYLTSLKYLNISYTRFSQLLQPISKLINLEHLEISPANGRGDGLEEYIPDEFYNLNKLKYLDIHSFALKGGLSSKIGNLINLESLILRSGDTKNAEFGGALPSELGNLINLRVLNLILNSFSGEIPSSLGNLTNLEYLYLGFNRLNGKIPASLGNLSNLNELWLQRNNLSGSIPSSLGNLYNLQAMYLFGNSLEGSIPDSFGQLSRYNLHSLYLQENLLSGEIPNSLITLSNLKYLFLEKNKFRFIDFSTQFLDYGKKVQYHSYAPQLKTDLVENINVVVGDSKTLTMCRDGRYIPDVDTFQWFKDGVAITDESINNRNYTISNLNTTNSGVYYCISKHPQITNAGKPTNQNLVLERNQIHLSVLDCTPKKGELKVTSKKLHVNQAIDFLFLETLPTTANRAKMALASKDASSTTQCTWTITDGEGNEVNKQENTTYTYSYVFTTPGSYLVKLDIMDENGCPASFTKEVIIKYPGECLNENISFSFETTFPNLSYVWTATDAAGVVVNSSTASDSSLYNVSFAIPGDYVIKLVANGTGKCETVFEKLVTVESCDDGGPGCMNHIAIVVDESGSVDETESKKIRAQLKSFMNAQAEVNKKVESMYISLIGMSDSDSASRTDHILQRPVSYADLESEGIVGKWIDNYGRRFGSSGISEGSDYWKSGLDVVTNTNFTIKPKLVFLITDGCQTADPAALKKTMEKFDNYQDSPDTSTDKPHLYVVGINNGFYVDDPVSTPIAARNQDPNYVPSLKKRSLTAKNSAYLAKSLQYLFNYKDNAFPIERIDGFDSAAYYAHDDFTMLSDEPYYFSDNIILAKVGCGLLSEKDFCNNCLSFQPEVGHEYLLSAWVKEETNIQVQNYEKSQIDILFYNNAEALDSDPDDPSAPSQIIATFSITPAGDIIDGWQRISGRFTVPENTITAAVVLNNKNVGIPAYFDDLRIHPVDGSVKTFVYDSETFKLMSELDENNYSTFYEYDNEGGLVRVKKETSKGVKTIQETRSGSFISK